MALLVVLAKAQTFTASGAPSAEAIAAAFRAAQPETPSFGWSGPAPRITRVNPGILDKIETRAAWIGEWPKNTTNFGPPIVALATALRESISRELATATGDTWTVTTEPFNAAMNGPITWWRTGEASRSSRTRNAPASSLTQPLQEASAGAENPVGPNVTRGSIQGVTEDISGTGGQLARDVRGTGQSLNEETRQTIERVTYALKVTAVLVAPVFAWLIARELRRNVRQNPRNTVRRGRRR
jgi:hypothetical protein